MIYKCLFCEKPIKYQKYYLDVKEGILEFCSGKCLDEYMKIKY